MEEKKFLQMVHSGDSDLCKLAIIMFLGEHSLQDMQDIIDRHGESRDDVYGERIVRHDYIGPNIIHFSPRYEGMFFIVNRKWLIYRGHTLSIHKPRGCVTSTSLKQYIRSYCRPTLPTIIINQKKRKSEKRTTTPDDTVTR